MLSGLIGLSNCVGSKAGNQSHVNWWLCGTVKQGGSESTIWCLSFWLSGLCWTKYLEIMDKSTLGAKVVWLAGGLVGWWVGFGICVFEPACVQWREWRPFWRLAKESITKAVRFLPILHAVQPCWHASQSATMHHSRFPLFFVACCYAVLC